MNEVKFDDKGYIEIADQTMKLAHEVEVDDNGTMNVEGKGRVVGPILFFLMLSIIFRISSFC